MVLRVPKRRVDRARRRTGAAALDYILVLGVILPLAALLMWVVPRIIRAAYDMVTMLITWPFL